MSSIDQRVVQMQFDNKQFDTNVTHTIRQLDELKKSLNFSGLKTGIEQIADSTKHLALDSVKESVESLSDKFSALGVIGVTALMNITNQALETGKKVISAFTIDPIKTGFQEYETQINATQTILANTQKEGATIEDVNAALDELNLYADKTIYNFTEMTRNIGTFTAAGVDLKTSVSAIKGIANLAAVSGSTSQQASTAMYQLSQALAAGTVKLMDWNSVVNAGMGGAVFQNAIMRTARVHGVAIDQMIESEGSFRETLSKGWLTSEILTDTLETFTGDLTEAQLLAKGYSIEQTKEIMAMGLTASDAATKVKTFTQLVDTLKEAAQSGWSGSWRLIIGDFEEAKELYTKISDVLGGVIEQSNESRIRTLTEWKELGGRDSLIASVTNLVKGLSSAIKPVSDAFHRVFVTISGADLYGITKKFEYFTRGLYLTEQGQKNLSAAAEALFRIIKTLATAIGAGVKVFGKMLSILSPVVTVVLYLAGAIGVVINALFSMFESFDRMKEAFGSVKDFFWNLVNIFKNSEDTLSGILNVMFEIFDQAIKNGFALISQVTDGLFDQYLNNIYQGFRYVAYQVYLAIKEVQNAFLTGNWDNVLAPIKALSPKIEAFFNEVEVSYIKGGRGLAGVIEIVFDQLANVVRSVFNLWTRITGKEVEGYKEYWVTNIQNVRNAVVDAVADFKEKIEAFDWEGLGLQPVIDFLSKAKDVIVILAGQVKDAIFSLLDAINPLKVFTNSVSQLTSSMGVSFEGFGEKLKQIFSGISFGEVIKIVDTTVVTVLTAALFKLATSIKNVSKGISRSGLPELLKTLTTGIKDTFDSVGDVLKDWQLNIKSDIIMKIAKAVAILAVALIALSFVPSDKLTSGLIAIGGLIGEMTIALIALQKVIGFEEIAKLSGLSKLFIALSAAVLILSFAVGKLAAIDSKKINQGFLAVLGLVSSMTIAGAAMSQYTGDIAKGSVAFVLLAMSVNILAKAVDRFAKLDSEGLVRGLKAVIVLMAAMTAAINFMPKDKIINKKVFVELALALTLLSVCVKIIGGMDPEQAKQGVVAIAALIAELGIASRLATDVKLTNFIQMSLAVAMLVPVIAILGTIKPEKAFQGIVAVGAILTEFVAASIWAKQISAFGFMQMALAIDLLLPAVVILGVIPWKKALQGAIGIGVLLAELVVASRLMPDNGAKSGLGMMAMALGISVLAGALTGLSLIPFPLILIGLGELAIALGILIGAAYLARPVSSVLVALGAAFALLGVGAMGVGSGITLAAAGLATLAGLGAAAGVAIYNLGKAVLEVTKNAIIGFGEGLVGLAKIIKNSAPILAEGVTSLIQSLLESAASKWESFKETVGPMIESLIDFIATYGPKLIETGVGLLVSLIAGIGLRASELGKEGAKLIVNLINGIREKLPDLVEAGIGLAVDFIVAVANGLSGNITPILQAVGLLGTSIIEGLGQALIAGISWIVEKTLELGRAILNAIKNFFGIHSPSTVFNDIGVNLIQGLINGISSMIGAAVDMVTSLGTKILNLFKKDDEHEDAGQENMEGLTTGYKDRQNQAVNTAKTIQTSVIAALKSFNPKFVEAGQGNMVSFSQGLSKPLRQILETIDQMISTSVSRIKAFQSKFYTAGEYLVWGFIEGIDDNIKSAARKAAEMAKAAIDAAKAELDINSPSGVFITIGGNVVEGLVIGIRNSTDDVTDATKDMVSEQIKTMRDSLDDFSDLMDDVDTEPVITPVLDADDFVTDFSNLENWMTESFPAINGVRLTPYDPTLANDAGQILTGSWRPASPTEGVPFQPQPVTQNFYQYNTSPKALSRLEIYRQTRNQFVRFKEVVKKGR